MDIEEPNVAIIVAHPDDEILWAGGAILLHPQWNCHIASLCRASDPDRAPKFDKVMDHLGAIGVMADLDDGPEQNPLDMDKLQEKIKEMLMDSKYDLVITHGPQGEYTRHRRHEEVSMAVTNLWIKGSLATEELWLFAFEDGGKAYLPRAQEGANYRLVLPEEIWKEKRRIIKHIYGFSEDSWELRTTPKIEAFWTFNSSSELDKWITRR